MDSWGDTSFGNSSYGSLNNSSFNHSSAAGGGGQRSKVSVSAQLEINGLPAETDCNAIRARFGRYGRISRIILDHSRARSLADQLSVSLMSYYHSLGFTENKAFCYLDYEAEISCDAAIRMENQKKMDGRTLTVQKKSNDSSDSQDVRPSTT